MQYAYRCDRPECRREHTLNAGVEQRNALEGEECGACDTGRLRRVYAPLGRLRAGRGDLN